MQVQGGEWGLTRVLIGAGGQPKRHGQWGGERVIRVCLGSTKAFSLTSVAFKLNKKRSSVRILPSKRILCESQCVHQI